MKATEKVKQRPAETAGIGAMALANVAGRIFHWDEDTILNVSIVVGLVPAGVTWVVNLVRD